MNVDHVALWVADLAETKRFYTDVLDLDVLKEFESDDGTQNLKVKGGTPATFQFKYNPDREGGVDPSAVAHLALLVDDVGAAFETVTRDADYEAIEDPAVNEGAGIENAFVRDPSGYTVELVAEL